MPQRARCSQRQDVMTRSATTWRSSLSERQALIRATVAFVRAWWRAVLAACEPRCGTRSARSQTRHMQAASGRRMPTHGGRRPRYHPALLRSQRRWRQACRTAAQMHMGCRPHTEQAHKFIHAWLMALCTLQARHARSVALARAALGHDVVLLTGASQHTHLPRASTHHCGTAQHVVATGELCGAALHARDFQSVAPAQHSAPHTCTM